MPISYDGALNPLSYVINGSECTLTWTQGRRLASISGEEGTDYTYTYNDEGIRTGKTVNGVEHIYHLSGTQILSEEWTENGVQHLIVYSYDASGYPISMTYRKSTDAATAAEVYFLATNLQGDVTYIYDIDGNRVVTYNYDAWGNILSISGTKASTIGRYNPFRYRGYYYDNETGLYYVSSRYYDPEIGRWINADDTANLGVDGSILSYNLFAYCLNNPINRFDINGNWSLPNWAKVAIGAVATVAAVVVTVATGGAALPVLIGVAASTVGGAVTSAISHRVTTGSWEGAGKAALDGAADGFMMGGLSALGSSLISAGIKAVKTARQGITIGRGMEKVNRAAGLTDTTTYSKDALWKPLRESYYNGIKKVFGEKAANSVSCACNKLYIKTMRTLGAVIYDSGLNGYAQAGQFYGMELKILAGYGNLVQMY